MQILVLLIVSTALHANAIAAFQFNATTCVQLGSGCVFEPVTRQCICSNTPPSDEPIPSSTAAPPATLTARPTIAPSSSLPPSQRPSSTAALTKSPTTSAAPTAAPTIAPVVPPPSPTFPTCGRDRCGICYFTGDECRCPCSSPL
ncbi:unnamed protein product [Aphanomyces euteiches]|uniref:Pacifastin domain-containing protein n=1 Tax=Aphanomyces euteiches TaxID=100861 RepID=A0A6G0X328_9STRA|nr:hypothetical protein Ae201684_009128 [Aphanomyces euteiches]KAH9073664.1 hypothetical protein Ae201684P_003167 [Aphanomyces euteiches]KAH9134478.1 hypothetical protein AeRB84_019740 [Aphanomyces euteiches]